MLITDDLTFQKLDFSGLQTLVNWARNEGWNPGPHDAEAFWQTDPEGFYGIFSKEKMVGGGAVVSYNGEFVFLDIPGINGAAAEMVKKYDAKYVYECARMYYGKPPEIDVTKVYGITTFELG